MKILMILDNLSCDSGVSSIVMNLYNKIDRNRIKIDFLIFREGNNSYVDMVKKMGSNVFYLKNPLRFKQNILAILELKKFFKNHSKDYDVVHLHSPTLNEFTLKYAKKYGIRNRIIHSHSTMTSRNKIKKILNSILLANIHKYANNYWACSTEAAIFLYGEKFCKTHDIELIKNAVEPDKYRYNCEKRKELRKEYNVQEKTVIAHISNFSSIKNVTFLIPIIENATKIRDDLIFAFIGDGTTKRVLEEKIKEKNLEKYCMFLGRKKDVANLLNLIDILVLPSIKEGLPVITIEAQANGALCLISDSVTREADVGNTKFIPLIQEEWLNEIIKSDPISDEKRLKLSQHINDTDFNIEKEANRVEQIYLSMK